MGLKMIKKQKSSPRCSNCGQSGHSKTSTKCTINILHKDNLIKQIKELILCTPVSDTMDDDIKYVSNKLNISYNMCKTLFKEIPQKEIMERTMNLKGYIQELKSKKKLCEICKHPILLVYKNTARIWKGQTVCDTCWDHYHDVREILRAKIDVYKPSHCVLCFKKKTRHERFHFDHINIFDKSYDVGTMIIEGHDIKQIYAEIDKCQLLCIECHNIITDLEVRTGFIKIKKQLAKQRDSDEKTKILAEYKSQYQKMFSSIQKDLRMELIFLKKQK